MDGGTTEYGFDAGRLGEGGELNLVSWKLDVNANSEDGLGKRGFNGMRNSARQTLISSDFDGPKSSYQKGRSAKRDTETFTTYSESTSVA